MFIDQIKVTLTAGRGGDGVVAWRREKYLPKGGPEGGNGGRGGSIILKADTQIFCLDNFRNRRLIKAQNGQPGGGSLRSGKKGEDLILKVPCGTLVKDSETGTVLYDLTEDGQTLRLCEGGKGGLGNYNFKTSTNQAPTRHTLGKKGESKEVQLELKMIADVGLIGMPNAGKSTFMSRIAKRDTKVAAYPFTTLHPNIGFIEFEDYTRLHIADIPGIIQGAHQNKGLGLDFLRHIERTHVLVLLLDAAGTEGRDPFDDYQTVLEELKAYDPKLLDLPLFIALNKCDDPASEEPIERFKERFTQNPDHLFTMSAKEGMGVDKFIQKLEEIKNTIK